MRRDFPGYVMLLGLAIIAVGLLWQLGSCVVG